MKIVVTPSPHPLVTKPEVVFEKVKEKLMTDIGQGKQDIQVDGMTVTMELDDKQEKLFAEQDLRMEVDRTITSRYINILDDVVNGMT